MDEVHGVADVLEHAPEGHEEVTVVVTFQHAGGRGEREAGRFILAFRGVIWELKMS